MKCLTILNPYPAYILLPASHRDHKRVENRKWPLLSYRGELLIHAGKSKALMNPDNAYRGLTFEWGKIVGVRELVDCVSLGWDDHLDSFVVPEVYQRRYPWLAAHRHTEGPHCWILQNVRRFPIPITCRGAQGLFNVRGLPLQRVQEQLKEAVPVDRPRIGVTLSA